MSKTSAKNFLTDQLEAWEALSAEDRARAAAYFNMSEDALKQMLSTGGLNQYQLNTLNQLGGFTTGNAGYDPSIAASTNILSGSTANQGILQNAINQWNGWTLSPLNSSPGMNAPLQTLQDRGYDIVNSQGQAGLSELVDAQRTYGDVIAAGGMTPDLKALQSLGRSMVASGGFTPELMGFISQAASQIMQFGEMTPEMRRVFNSAMEIVDAGGEGGALLPTEQIISFARDEAAARGIDQFAAAQRAAIQRGMTPGAVTGTGGELAEFADQAAEMEAKAIRDANLGAQEQRLQQFLASQGTAAQIAAANASQRAGVASGLGSLNGGALSYAGNYVNAGSNMLQTAAQQASNMYGASVTGMNQAANTFLDREKMGGDWLLGANDAARQNVAFGADLARTGLGTEMEGISLFNQSRGGANNDILNALGLGSNIAQDGQNNTLNATGQLINIGGQYMDSAKAIQQIQGMTAQQKAELMARPGFLQQLAMTAGQAGIEALMFGAGKTDWLGLFGGSGGSMPRTPSILESYGGNLPAAPNVGYRPPPMPRELMY